VAVLTRRNADIAPLYAELTARNVPVEIVGLGGLLHLPEILDITATLRLIEDVTANPELIRLLTGPRWQVGARDLALLGRRARELTRLHDATWPTKPKPGSTASQFIGTGRRRVGSAGSSACWTLWTARARQRTREARERFRSSRLSWHGYGGIPGRRAGPDPSRDHLIGRMSGGATPGSLGPPCDRLDAFLERFVVRRRRW
jgi:hypothetical protein